MHVAILAHQLRVAGGLSVGKNIIAALHDVADDHSYFLLMPQGVGYETCSKPTRASCYYYRRRLGPVGHLLFESRQIPIQLRRFAPDVVWSLGNYGLTRPNAKQAILLHHPYLVYDPKQQPRRLWRMDSKTRYSLWRLRRSLPTTQLVFCQTDTMADRLRSRLAYSGRVATLPNAVSRFVVVGAASARPPVLEPLAGKFVLFCLTRYYPHKNLESLVELFRQHKSELGDVAVVLTLHPRDSRRAARLLRTISAPALRTHIVNAGPVAQQDLASYFEHADGLLLPTVMESFTATYLEAMRFGTPILTSDLDFAREVCGPAAIYFDPWDVASIKDAILRLQRNPSLASELVSRGRARCATIYHTWHDIVATAMRQLEDLAHDE